MKQRESNGSNRASPSINAGSPNLQCLTGAETICDTDSNSLLCQTKPPSQSCLSKNTESDSISDAPVSTSDSCLRPNQKPEDGRQTAEASCVEMFDDRKNIVSTLLQPDQPDQRLPSQKFSAQQHESKLYSCDVSSRTTLTYATTSEISKSFALKLIEDTVNEAERCNAKSNLSCVGDQNSSFVNLSVSNDKKLKILANKYQTHADTRADSLDDKPMESCGVHAMDKADTTQVMKKTENAELSRQQPVIKEDAIFSIALPPAPDSTRYVIGSDSTKISPNCHFVVNPEHGATSDASNTSLEKIDIGNKARGGKDEGVIFDTKSAMKPSYCFSFGKRNCSRKRPLMEDIYSDSSDHADSDFPDSNTNAEVSNTAKAPHIYEQARGVTVQKKENPPKHQIISKSDNLGLHENSFNGLISTKNTNPFFQNLNDALDTSMETFSTSNLDISAIDKNSQDMENKLSPRALQGYGMGSPRTSDDAIGSKNNATLNVINSRSQDLKVRRTKSSEGSYLDVQTTLAPAHNANQASEKKQETTRSWLRNEIAPALLKGIRKLAEDRPASPLKILGKYLVEFDDLNLKFPKDVSKRSIVGGIFREESARSDMAMSEPAVGDNRLEEPARYDKFITTEHLAKNNPVATSRQRNSARPASTKYEITSCDIPDRNSHIYDERNRQEILANRSCQEPEKLYAEIGHTGDNPSKTIGCINSVVSSPAPCIFESASEASTSGEKSSTIKPSSVSNMEQTSPWLRRAIITSSCYDSDT